MPDYKTMCFTLFNSVTDAINRLQEAQRAGEEAYISSGDAQILVCSAASVKVEDEEDKEKRRP